MGIARLRQSQRSLQQYLPGRVVQQVEAADYLGNPLVRIIDHDGKLVGEEVVATPNDEIADFVSDTLTKPALQLVFEVDRLRVPIGTETQRRGACRVAQSGPAATRIERLAIAGARQQGQFGTAAGAGVDAPGISERLERRRIDTAAPALEFYVAVPLEAERIEGVQDTACCARNLAGPVEVLDTQAPPLTFVSGVEIAADSSDQRPEVQVASR